MVELRDGRWERQEGVDKLDSIQNGHQSTRMMMMMLVFIMHSHRHHNTLSDDDAPLSLLLLISCAHITPPALHW